MAEKAKRSVSEWVCDIYLIIDKLSFYEYFRIKDSMCNWEIRVSTLGFELEFSPPKSMCYLWATMPLHFSSLESLNYIVLFETWNAIFLGLSFCPLKIIYIYIDVKLLQYRVEIIIPTHSF